MKRFVLRATAALAVGAAALAIGGGCRQKERAIRVDAEQMSSEDRANLLPAPVREAIGRDFPGATIDKVEKETARDGAEHWEVTFKTAEGKKMEREFDASGSTLGDN